MYKVLCLCFLIAAATAAPADEVPIVAQEMNVEPDGQFHWSYESGDGTKQVQDGELRALDKDVQVGVMHGTYEYTGDDGQVYSVSYVADENGFQPQGAHIHPVPEPIAKALAYLATVPPPKN